MSTDPPPVKNEESPKRARDEAPESETEERRSSPTSQSQEQAHDAAPSGAGSTNGPGGGATSTDGLDAASADGHSRGRSSASASASANKPPPPPPPPPRHHHPYPHDDQRHYYPPYGAPPPPHPRAMPPPPGSGGDHPQHPHYNSKIEQNDDASSTHPHGSPSAGSARGPPMPFTPVHYQYQHGPPLHHHPPSMPPPKSSPDSAGSPQNLGPNSRDPPAPHYSSMRGPPPMHPMDPRHIPPHHPSHAHHVPSPPHGHGPPPQHMRPSPPPPPPSGYAMYRDEHYHHHQSQRPPPPHWPGHPMEGYPGGHMPTHMSHGYYDSPPPAHHHPHHSHAPYPPPGSGMPPHPSASSLAAGSASNASSPYGLTSSMMDHHGAYRYPDSALRLRTDSSVEPYARSNEEDSHSDLARRALMPTPKKEPGGDGDGDDDRGGATSPSQIYSTQREEVSIMGCTCKKTKCLKLYCQCFAIQIYCGGNCRCLTCKNTSEFDMDRQQAKQNILNRNPSAFDNKFKHAPGDQNPIGSPGFGHHFAQGPAANAPALAHKLGCKCRKSACMKKYCECYAGNVRCSDNCRCVGCKNTGDGHGEGSSRMLAPSPLKAKRSRVAKRDEDAAQNLAFMKTGSPASVKARTFTPSGYDGRGLVSDAGVNHPPAQSEPPTQQKSGKDRGDPTKKPPQNDMYLAAMAMAEMTENSVEDEEDKPGEDGDDDDASTEDEVNDDKTRDLSETKSRKPKDAPDASDSAHSRSSKSLARTYRSPKRKKPAPLLDDENDDGTPSVRTRRSHSGNPSESSSPAGIAVEDAATPSKSKRSRTQGLHSSDKNSPEETDGITEMESVAQTPTSKSGRAQDATPMTARCIDFGNMKV